MNPRKTYALLILPVAFFILSGCSINTNGNSTAGTNDGGVFRSDNRGNNWTQKTLIPGVARVTSFSGSNANSLALDPTDNKAVYFGTVIDGLFFSLDGAETWQKSKSLGSVAVKSIAVDPQYRCTILVAYANKVVRSTDCARSWNQIYFDNDPSVKVNSVVTDPKNGALIYIGTSRGEVIKSEDYGQSWQTINRFDTKLLRLFINPLNGKVIFAAIERDGLAVSTNGGRSWSNLKKNLASFEEGTTFKDLAFSGENASRAYLASRYGLLYSDNNGQNWQKIDLITPKEKATINALAVNPQNDQEIYYVTNTTFYRSLDGGKTWTTKNLPTSRAGWDLVIDPKSPTTLYMGARALSN
jgi:photosystem II stability/assembly factor-like uncharacterized protein